MYSSLPRWQSAGDNLEGVHLRGLKDAIAHDDSSHSGKTHSIYCNDQQIEDHDHLTEYMPEIAAIIHRGVDSQGEGELPIGANVTFEHVERAKFTKFRSVCGLNESHYIKSIEDMDGGGTEPSGKSGSLFWFSPDKSFLMKSITQLEVDKILEILDDYIDHFESAKQKDRLVLLSRFYGLYTIRVKGGGKGGKDESLHMICMNNVFGTQKPDRTYDLKGTTEDRYVQEGPGTVMKDLNYAGMAVGLPAGDVDRILGAVEADSEFTRSQNIMDYSLLLGVYEDPKDATNIPGGMAAPVFKGRELEGDSGDGEPRAFRVGFIDMLVDYSGMKIAAHWLKKPTLGFCMCEEIDTEPPPYYQERFYASAENLFVEA